MANKVYAAPETAIVFAPSGGDVVFTPTSVANAAGRISAQWDRGANSKPALYHVDMKSKFQATPTIGSLLRCYLHQHTVTGQLPGGLGTSDAAQATEDLFRNWQWLMSLVVDRASASAHAKSRPSLILTGRYVSVGWWNASGATLSATDADHELRLVPVPPEIQ